MTVKPTYARFLGAGMNARVVGIASDGTVRLDGKTIGQAHTATDARALGSIISSEHHVRGDVSGWLVHAFTGGI